MTSISEIQEEGSSKFTSAKIGNQTVKLHYNEFGVGDKVVAMVHGSGPGASSWSNFHRNVGPLVDAGFRVLLIDCPGWSKSDPFVNDKAFRSEVNAEAIKAVLDAAKVQKSTLIGNSMGAHSSVAFALAYPERVDKLVCMGGGTGGISSFMPMPTEGIKLINALYREPTMENLKRMMNVFVFDPSSLTQALLDGRMKNMQEQPLHLINFTKSAELNPKQYPDVGHRLSEIKAPTLIVWGRDDRFLALDTALRLVAGITNSELHVFNRCGHWAQWEHADRFNTLLLDFLHA